MNYVDADYIFEYGTKGEISFVPLHLNLTSYGSMVANDRYDPITN